MEETATVADLSARLGLDYEQSGGSARLERHGYRLALPGALVDEFDPENPVGRHLLFALLFGVRLAIDRKASTFDVADERPERPEQVYHAHEIPSVYGDRLPRLVSRLSVAWFEALTGKTPLDRPWILDELTFVYILETGKHLHTFCECDVQAAPIGRKKLVRDARHALFYEAYKLKPREKKRVDAGKLFLYRTAEGLGATRVMLLPDYDYDAARAGGCFSTPSRDTLLIGRPREESGAEAIRRKIVAWTERLTQSEAFPLSTRVGTLTTDEARPGEHVGGVELPLAVDEAPEIWRPPDDIALDRTDTH